MNDKIYDLITRLEAKFGSIVIDAMARDYEAVREKAESALKEIREVFEEELKA